MVFWETWKLSFLTVYPSKSVIFTHRGVTVRWFCQAVSSGGFSGSFVRWFCQVVLSGGFVRWFCHIVFSGVFVRWFCQVICSVVFLSFVKFCWDLSCFVKFCLVKFCRAFSCQVLMGFEFCLVRWFRGGFVRWFFLILHCQLLSSFDKSSQVL